MLMGLQTWVKKDATYWSRVVSIAPFWVVDSNVAIIGVNSSAVLLTLNSDDNDDDNDDAADNDDNNLLSV